MPDDPAVPLGDERNQRIAVGFDHSHQFGLALMAEFGPGEGGADDGVDSRIIRRPCGADNEAVRHARCPGTLPVSCRQYGHRHRPDAFSPCRPTTNSYTEKATKRPPPQTG